MPLSDSSRTAASSASSFNRRDFTKTLALGGAGAWLATANTGFAQLETVTSSAPPPPLPPAPAKPDENYWKLVRQQFAMSPA